MRESERERQTDKQISIYPFCSAWPFNSKWFSTSLSLSLCSLFVRPSAVVEWMETFRRILTLDRHVQSLVFYISRARRRRGKETGKEGVNKYRGIQGRDWGKSEHKMSTCADSGKKHNFHAAYSLRRTVAQSALHPRHLLYLRYLRSYATQLLVAMDPWPILWWVRLRFIMYFKVRKRQRAKMYICVNIAMTRDRGLGYGKEGRRGRRFKVK